MIRRLFHEVSLALAIGIAITLLVVYALFTIGAWLLFGWRIGLFFGFVLLVFFEGMPVILPCKVLMYTWQGKTLTINRTSRKYIPS